MKEVLLYLWQLPQNIIALTILLINIKSKKKYDFGYIVKHLSDCAISLGNYMIFDLDSPITCNKIKHERGHQKQSLYLGPLYLLLIGLPSAIGNIIHRFKKFDYYKQPWEAWADRLGGVKRLKK